MIYSKPFPDGTIKTRGSDFGSVSWSHWGADREWRGPGMWQGLHVPWGRPAGDSRILNSAGELGLSRACADSCPGVPGPICAPVCSGPLCPPECSALLFAPAAGNVFGAVTLQSRAVFQRSSGPAWNRECLSAVQGGGSSQQPPAREGPWPGHRSSCPGSSWGQAGGQRSFSGWRSVTLWVPHPASHLAFSYTLALFIFNY